MSNPVVCVTNWILARLKWSLVLVMMGSLSLAVHSAERLHIYTENYPPYNFPTNGKGFAHNRDDISGICTDMVKAMMANVQYDYVMKLRAWSWAYDWVQTRKDHGLFCTARTDQREDQFQWVGPLASIKWTLFAAPDSDIKLSSLEDARQYKIAGYKGDVMSDFLADKGFDMVMSMSGEQNPRRLVLGQVDLWVTDGLVGPLVAKEKYGIEGLKPVLVFRETPMYLAVSKQTDPKVVADLQRGLDKARASGTLAAISEHYAGKAAVH